MAIIPSIVNFILSVGPAITGGGSNDHGVAPTYYPPLDYKPKPTGIPFTLKNESAVADRPNSNIPITSTSMYSIMAPEESTSSSSYILPSVSDSSFASTTPTSPSSITVPMQQTTDSSIASAADPSTSSSAVYPSTVSYAVGVSTQQASSSSSVTPEQPTSSSIPSPSTTPSPTAVSEQPAANSTSADIHATLDGNGQQVNNNAQTGQEWESCSSGGAAAGYWYANIEHNGQSSFLESGSKENYTVFRNVVTDFKADNTGATDASGAIQNAIQAGPTNGPDRGSHFMGTTGQPAIIYLPPGTYLLSAALQFYVGTVIVGDPTNPPTLKAASEFSGDHMIYAKDPSYVGTINFQIGIKNIILDSTAVAATQAFNLVDWTVSQATQLANVVFNMPTGDTNHVGLTTQYDYNSNLIMNDLWFQGGSIGMKLSGQQWVFKSLRFTGTKIGVIAGGTDIVFMDCHFEQGDIGIDAGGTSGSLTVIDSSGSGLNSFIVSGDSGNAGNAIILENIQNTGTTVTLGGEAKLSGPVADTWVHGTVYDPGNANKRRADGDSVTTPRPSNLAPGGKYFTMPPPTYREYSADQVVNIKSVPGLPVYGDGSTDDSQNINRILTEKRGCQLIYFPAGTYIVADTIFVPGGTRIIGDAFASVISATGNLFKDEASPRAMVRFGYPGDMGIAQVSDMMFTVADILPGCKMVEVNIAGEQPGDVGFWNTHFRIGGAVGSRVQTDCAASPGECKAAFGLLHLSTTSSAYIENMWGWTADHDLDGDHTQNIGTGRGLLVEATSATWLIGTGFEHHTLYQYNFERARNVFSALQQSETPYWQGPGNLYAPAPWADHPVPSDPNFSHCAPEDANCRMALFERISGSSDLFLYGGGNWVFFNANGDCKGDCQKNMLQIIDSTRIYLYGTNSKSTTNMVLEGSQVIATQNDNAGGWGGVIAAYLYNT
ncbi:exo-beta-1 [Aspergillus affinis]|uniref:exo-beta-1 n=1 Tax=Aspergillus affinis TaxID=1070780 RepID=UPI0022FF09C5|nr:exo-beta-1 [Aspergillus affinis]KAI9035159.1 exo-beta-1 [Aspergillus affinis]